MGEEGQDEEEASARAMVGEACGVWAGRERLRAGQEME